MGNKLEATDKKYQFRTKLKSLVSSPIKSFIVLASVFGMLIIILAPPLTGGDEEAHFVRAYGISEGNFIIHSDEDVSMPKTYRETIGCLQVKRPVAGDTYMYNYGRYAEQKKAALHCAFTLKARLSDKEPVKTTAAGYSPMTYIPQVAAILLGRIFSMPIVAMVYLVRIFTLIAYILLIVAALRLLPHRKWALVGVALLPVPLMQVINPGGDYMLMGATAIFVAAILRSRGISERDLAKYKRALLVITVVAALFMVTPKGIFPGICFLPLIFFFASLRRLVGVKLVLFASVLVGALLWQMFGAPVAAGQVQAASSSSILSFPYAFLKTMFFRANFHSWVDSDFIYGNLGLGFGSQVGMPAIVITLINMLVGIYFFVQYSEHKVSSLKTKFENKLLTTYGVLACMAVIGGSFAALYLLATTLQTGDNIINGVSTRYFYPAFLLLAILPFYRYITTSRRFYTGVTLVGSIVVLSAQCLAIAIRYKWGIL